MAYDERLAIRIQECLGQTDALAELKMFGGWCATVDGNMAVGVLGNDVIVRVGPDAYAEALSEPGVREFDFAGRPMAGWVFVNGRSVDTAEALEAWVERGIAFARSLPPKTQATRERTKRRSGG
jgi:TfoX/Sxy family transcriptional regulator of competence genes